nr:ABC transporter permease subunit [uncultured Cohaesibacter sp.]
MAKRDRQSSGYLRRGLLFAVGVGGMLALWQVGHVAYGSLVLPGVGETFVMLGRMIRAGEVVTAVQATAFNALAGWCISVVMGVMAGGLAGRFKDVRFVLQPVSIILLGIPAIAWIVLALLWFGGRWAVVFTVAVATAPMIFAAALHAVRSLDGDLAQMARAFHAPPRAMVSDVYGPHMLAYLYPALATTLAMSWKVSIMAELLSGSGGIGDGIAAARARVDTAQLLAWVVVVVFILIVLDHLLLRLVRERMHVWRRQEEGGRHGG